MRFRFRSVLLVSICLLAGEALAALPVSNRDEWMGIYYKGQKIGYSHLTIKKGRWGRKGVYRRDYSVSFRFIDGGEKRIVRLDSTLQAQHDLTPLDAVIEYARYKASQSEAFDYGKAEFWFRPRQVKYQMTVAGKTSRDTIPIASNSHHRSGSIFDLRARKLKVGDKFTVPHLRPGICVSPDEGITLQYHYVTSRLSVVRREAVKAGGKSYDTFVVVDEIDGRKLTTWIASDGTVIKEEYPGGITALRETSADARKGMTGPGPSIPNPKKNTPKLPADSERS